MVVTNGRKMSNGHVAGLWLSEFAEPYEELRAAGYEVTVVSPDGGESTIDENSLDNNEVPEKWHELAEWLKNTAPIDTVQSADYDGIFLPGGHGAMFDLPDNHHLQKLLRDFTEADKSIGAVCHGPAGLTGVVLANGEHLVAGKNVSAFTDSEERGVQLENEMPFLLESKLRDLGANFSAKGDWEEHVVTDGKLVTGQNPQSSVSVAKGFIETLN
ncbi:type 1 glutamine amidotransferase domain-containing protein [Shouchella shacheensis]|uniref:type 1 glutamine amidotransferase domain-containing protein n=1 Tax=Shouchella shacheensis TaxID=1649580 RepID=UPI0007403D89|nr:type 1 glutamine amidotransferase domain-containing protein [Shouchella shacheensis]